LCGMCTALALLHVRIAPLVEGLAFSRGVVPSPAGLIPVSFPPRRSSDLAGPETGHPRRADPETIDRATQTRGDATGDLPGRLPRSEEHTSELQSRFDLVCRLLLEKKKLGSRRGHTWTLRPGCDDDEAGVG